MLTHAPDWTAVSAGEQVALSRSALRHAAETVAGQADGLAIRIATGEVPACVGSDALRLLASLRECALWARRVARTQH
jgi:hypothetical protein